MGKAIPTDSLLPLRQRLDHLPPKSPERATQIAAMALLYSISVTTVYGTLRAFQKPIPHTGVIAGNCVQRPGMKSAWYLAASQPGLSPQTVMNMYGRRWGIECSFRDIKDYKFGMGMAHMHTRSPQRRDRLFLLSALCIVFLTLPGKAGDSIGLERTIKANTVKTRNYSFWQQEGIYYALFPGMKESQLLPLLEKFAELLNRQVCCRKILGVL